MRDLPRSLVAGTGSAAAYLVLRYALVLPEPAMGWSLGLGLCVYGGLLMVLPRERRLIDEMMGRGGQWASCAAEVAPYVESGRERVAAIRSYADQADTRGREHIEQLASAASRVVEGLLEDPGDLGRSRKFVTQYLDAGLEAVRSYVGLAERSDVGSVDAVRAKCLEVLEELADAFEGLYRRNQSNEALSLDVDLDVLRHMIRSEGL